MPCSLATRSALARWPLTMATTSKSAAALKAGTWTVDPKPVPMTPTRSRPSLVEGIARYHAVETSIYVEASGVAALFGATTARRLAAGQRAEPTCRTCPRHWLARRGRTGPRQWLGDDRRSRRAADPSVAQTGSGSARYPAAAHHVCWPSVLGRPGSDEKSEQDSFLQEPVDGRRRPVYRLLRSLAPELRGREAGTFDHRLELGPHDLGVHARRSKGDIQRSEEHT